MSVYNIVIPLERRDFALGESVCLSVCVCLAVCLKGGVNDIALIDPVSDRPPLTDFSKCACSVADCKQTLNSKKF